MKTFLFLVLSVTSTWAITLTELTKDIDKKVLDVGNTVSELKMTIIRRNGKELVRNMRLSYLDDKKQPKVLIEFLTPKDVRGTKLLTYINSKKANDQWLYLPVLKRAKRIVGKTQKGSFMGSEFSYEDFGRQDSTMFKYDEQVDEITLDGVAMYKGVRYPKNSASLYSKQVIYVSKDKTLLEKIEYFDRKKRLLKVAKFSNYKEYDGLFRVGTVFMKNVKTKKATRIEWVKDTIHAKLKAKNFTKRALKK